MKKNPLNLKSKQDLWPWITLGIIIIFTIIARIPLLSVPLERDEGAYAYGGQLILQGLPESAKLYLERFPAIYFIYALFMLLFGQTIIGVHIGLLIVNVATIVLVFLLAKRFLDNSAAIAASAFFSVISLSENVQGLFANAEHFLALSAIGGILLILNAINSNKLFTFFISGILLGISFVIKQQGIFFIIFAGLYFLFITFKKSPVLLYDILKKAGIYALGAVIPFSVMMSFQMMTETFGDPIFWIIKYPSSVMETATFASGMQNFLSVMKGLIVTSPVLWILAFVGLILLFIDKNNKNRLIFIVGLLVFSFISISPGLFFRPHYFILILPVSALLFGATISFKKKFLLNYKSKKNTNVILFLIIIVAITNSIFNQKKYLFQLNPRAVSRYTYGPNPFPESIEISKYIKERSTEEDKIALLGSEPQVCFYANRHSATGYIMMYSLVEQGKYAEKFQKDMIREIENASPEFIVCFNIDTSWLFHPNSKKDIFLWSDLYIEKYYKLVGIADILTPKLTVYTWDHDLRGYKPLSNNFVLVFRKNREKN